MDGSIHEQYAKAQLVFASERYDTAISLCKELLETESLYVDAIVLLGNAYLVQSQFGEAEKVFEKAIDLEPQVGEHHFNLANSLFGQQRLSEAMQHYAEAIRLGCKDDVKQKIYYVVGVINQLDGKKAEALVNYDQSEAIAGANADRADILLKRIQIYVEQNNFEKAENYAVQLKLLMPNEFKSYQLLFQLYLEQRKINEASAILDEAEECCEKTPDVFTELAFDKAMLFCFSADQYPDEQETYYNKALSILSTLDSIEELKESDRCEAVITRADIYMKLNRYDEAQQLAQTVSQKESSELAECIDRADYTIIKCISHEKKFSDVSRYAEKLKKSKNLFYKHYGYYADAFATKQLAGSSSADLPKYVDKYNLAIAYYKNCTISTPGDFLAYLYRAKCYVDIGKFDKADELSRVLPADAQKTLQAYIEQERGRWNH